ncbi:hypothetical protein AMTRI_Chr01g129360 [Amborella trichopoda]
MYTMSCTRLDISFVLGKLSRYTSNPGQEHWNVVNRILQYLKGTVDYGLHYVGEPAVLEGYNYANWITVSDQSMSTSGWIFTFGGVAVAWSSKKQTCISKSTMESELVALEVASKEAE